MIKNNKTSIYFNAAELERINAYIGDKPIDSFKELILHAISQPVSNRVTTEEYAKLKAEFDELHNSSLNKEKVNLELHNKFHEADTNYHKSKAIIDKQGKRIAELETELIRAQKGKQFSSEKLEESQQKKTVTPAAPPKENSFILPVNIL